MICLDIRKYRGVKTTTRWSTVRIPAVVFINLRIFLYESQSLLKAVEAARSIMIGASMIRANGKTIPPYAAKFILGLARRAIIALNAGNSSAIKNQLKANGHQVLSMPRIVSSGLLSIIDLAWVE